LPFPRGGDDAAKLMLGRGGGCSLPGRPHQCDSASQSPLQRLRSKRHLLPPSARAESAAPGRRRSRQQRSRPEHRGRDIENQADDISDLGEHDRTNVATHSVEPADGRGSDMLTLCSRRSFQCVAPIRFDHNLRPESADRRRQGHDVNDVGSGVEDLLRGHCHCRMSKACLAAGRRAKVEFGDVTRGQHRAT